MQIPTYISNITIVINIVVPAVVGYGFSRVSHSAGLTENVRSRLVTAVTLFLVIWVTLAFGLGIAGFFAPNDNQIIPNIALTAVPLLLGIGLLSVVGFRRILVVMPLEWAVGIQFVRAIGIFFLILSARGLMPAAFAGPAGWGDVLTGIAAPVAAFALATKRRWARPFTFIWNLFGMADLVTAVTLGVLTSPGILQQLALNQPNTLITSFPIILIPSLAVPLMMILHIVSLYQLFAQPQQHIVETAVA
ncbi:MAG: hypothetical protein KC421_26075 [Anaerolineales bacterium]|nr:hypothetical protein [Anaerolineales bacterium]